MSTIADKAIAKTDISADVLLQHQIEQFLYHEAALLDDRRFREWFELLTDDLEYWMPVRTTVVRGDEEHEFAPLGGPAFFDDNKPMIKMRIDKLDTGFAWSEDPPSRTRHLVTNIRILERISESELKVGCNFILYRSRLSRHDEDEWIGRREDTLRKVDGAWKIAKRHILLDHVSLDAKNLSVFF